MDAKAPDVSLHQVCERDGLRSVNFDPRAFITGREGGSRIALSETMNGRVLLRGCLPAGRVEVSGDKAGCSLAAEITKVSVGQMVEGINRGLPGAMAFFAV